MRSIRRCITGGSGAPPQEELLEREVFRRVEPAGVCDLGQHDGFDRKPRKHVRPGALRQIERARERHVPVDVSRWNRDATALLGDQLDQVRGRRHEWVAVQQNLARGEDVGVTFRDGPSTAREIGRGQPGRNRPRATGARCLTIVANFFQRQRTCPMKPHCSEVGAGGNRHVPQLGGVADLHAAKSLGVQGAVARALDGGFECRIDVGISVRQRFLRYKAELFRYKANTSRSESVD